MSVPDNHDGRADQQEQPDRRRADLLLTAALTLDVRAAAHAYADLGWPVLPTCGPRCPGQPRHSNCDDPGKVSRIAGWQNKATTDHGIIDRWWRQWPDSNVAIVMGPTASGLVVADIDPRSGGLASLVPLSRAAYADQWAGADPGDEQELPQFPAEATVVTGSNGFHHYMLHPDVPEGVIRTRSHAFGIDQFPGIDVKARGGYVIAPPSVHACGGVYRWLRAATRTAPEVRPCPAWVVRMLARVNQPAPKPAAVSIARNPARTSPAAGAQQGQDGRKGARWVTAAIKGVLDDLQATRLGRNYAVNYAAWRIGRLVHDHPDVEFDPEDVLQAIVNIATGMAGDHPFEAKEAWKAIGREEDGQTPRDGRPGGYEAGKAGLGRSAA